MTRAVLLAATITMGLMAGVFGLYSHTIMRGLRRTDDRTFIGAFQQMDRAILNPWFMVSFLGALGFTALAAVLHLSRAARPVLLWIGVALVLYVIVFVITMAINVPLNNALKAAGDPDQMTDPAAVRASFDERRWLAWNHVRTVACTVAFASLTWALVESGRLL